MKFWKLMLPALCAAAAAAVSVGCSDVSLYQIDAPDDLQARIDEIAGPGAPAVVAGDFNTALEDPRFAEEGTLRILLDAGFRDAFEGIPESERPTLPANDFYPAATFDHILVRGLPPPLARSVGADIRTSDHRPLRASFPK